MFSHYLAFKQRYTTPAAQAGFGLIELMVSITIMAIVAAVILARQSSFNGAVLLRSQAYEIALTMREVQLNAISAVSDGSGDFRKIHGVYFDTSENGNRSYRIFRDADGDGFYDAGEEFGVQGFLDNRFEIDDIIVTGGSFTDDGSDITIVFERPNFDARFFQGSNRELDVTMVEIVLRRSGTTGTDVGDIKTIAVTPAGQIAVQ